MNIQEKLTNLNEARDLALRTEIQGLDKIIATEGTRIGSLPSIIAHIETAKQIKQLKLRELMLEYNESMELVTKL